MFCEYEVAVWEGIIFYLGWGWGGGELFGITPQSLWSKGLGMLYLWFLQQGCDYQRGNVMYGFVSGGHISEGGYDCLGIFQGGLL